MSACRSCGAPVEWVRTAAGKRMPIDVEPRVDGNIARTGRYAQGRFPAETVSVVEYVDPQAPALDLEIAPPDRFVSHFATCPDADSWRRPDGGV